MVKFKRKKNRGKVACLQSFCIFALSFKCGKYGSEKDTFGRG